MGLIDLLVDGSVPDDTLKQSTQGRSGTPDGNIFFDVANGEIELITVDELATIDFGSGAVANPFSATDGITMRALYGFERQERRSDETLRQYNRYFSGSYKYAGAYEMINGRKFDGTDRNKIRSSGLIERAADNTSIDRIYFGVRSLGSVESTSQPYYQLTNGGAPVDFNRAGDVDELVQVYGDTSNGDTGAGDFDSRDYLSLNLRTFGYNYDRKILSDSGVSTMDGYSTGFSLGESLHLTTGDYALADVYGGSQISPWTGMSLEKLATPQTETGFNEVDGDFTWVLNNTAGGSLAQCVAFLDALSQTDDDIDSGTETTTNGKRVGLWYTYNAAGKIVTQSGADTEGLFIENLPASDYQSVVFTSDTGDTKTYPFYVQVDISVGVNAKADANAWYQVFYEDGSGDQDFDAADAVTVKDSSGADVKGDVSGADVSFSYDYDGNTQAGLTAGTDKEVVVLVEGNGTAKAAITYFTLTRSATVSVSCEPDLETAL